MEVYLAQHGEARPESEDPARPLTDRGRAEVESVARHIAGAGVEVVRIFHSGKLRAEQTAEVFGRHLEPSEGVSEQPDLGPMDDPGAARQVVEEAGEAIMLVGHLPHLGRLASLLVSGDAEREVVSFKMGGVVCLGGTGGGWLVKWALTPEIVGG